MSVRFAIASYPLGIFLTGNPYEKLISLVAFKTIAPTAHLEIARQGQTTRL